MVPLSETTRVADYRPMLEAGAAIGASRLDVGGDSADFSVVAEKLAEICDLAPTTASRSISNSCRSGRCSRFAHAVEVLKRARQPNAHILIDALHVFRSNSALEQFAASIRK